MDNMIREGRTNEEILDYMSNETVAFHDSMNSETTGLYGYINGIYMDGTMVRIDGDNNIVSFVPKKAFRYNETTLYIILWQKKHSKGINPT